jgi:small subunit ribosomal protein S2
MTDITLRDLLEAGVHFGHQRRFRNPKANEYIFGERNGISIINLEKTLPLLKEALKVVKRIVSNGGRVMFVGTKRSASKIMQEEAERCAMPYVNHRWLGGMLTNYKTIKASIRRLKKLKKLAEDGTLVHLTKREALNIKREEDKLEKALGGIKDMGGLPDALFVIDVGHEKNAIKEANRLGIPVIGIVDTNSSPDGVDYPIPGNDDAMRSISFYAEKVANQILASKEEQKSAMSKYDEEFVEVHSNEEE